MSHNIKSGDIIQFKDVDGKVNEAIVTRYLEHRYGGSVEILYDDWRVVTIALVYLIEPKIVGHVSNPLSYPFYYDRRLEPENILLDKPQGSEYTIVVDGKEYNQQEYQAFIAAEWHKNFDDKDKKSEGY